MAKVANELIDRFADRGHAELVREFTFPYPTQVIAGILGLPREDYKQFQRWSIAILSFLAKQDEAITASREVEAYMTGILADRRRTPREDLISELAHAELDGERLSDDEIFSFLRLLLPAGVETTFRSTGNLLYLLLSEPDQLQSVRSDRSSDPRGDRGGLAPRNTPAQHHPARDEGHGDRRCASACGVDDHVDARSGQPRGDSIRRARPFRHSPGQPQATHVVRARSACCALECTWPGWRCGLRSISSSIACRSCASIPRRTTPTSEVRYSALRRPFPYSSPR